MATITEASVFIVEDDASVRESLLLLLRLKLFRAVAFESADRFLEEVTPDSPGCLLLDLRMKGMSGLELQARMAERGFRMPIIIISAHGDVSAARTAFKAGAIDFLEKPLDPPTLLAAVRVALDRDRDVRTQEEATAATREKLARLSGREREVLWLVADGYQNRDIAVQLGVSPRTVEIYKARMMEKLQVRRLPDLLRAVQGLRRDE